MILRFGHSANAVQAKELAAIARRYYRAAAARDASRTCSTMYSAIVRATVIYRYGRMPALRGTTCVAVMSKFLALHHREFASDARSMRVLLVRLNPFDVYLLLGFSGYAGAREFSLRWDGRSWKIDQPIDEPMP
jgi:hypothetical protein